MNRKEIEKLKNAGTEVAVNLGYSASQQPLGEFHRVGRATVVEINPDGRPLGDGESRWADRNRSSKTVKLTIHELPDGGSKDEYWTSSRMILSSWAEYRAARAAYLEAQERGKIARAAKARRQEASIASLKDLLDELGIQARVEAPRYIEAATVTLTEAQLRAVIEAGERAGVHGYAS